MKSYRQNFLEEFLKLYGVKEIIYKSILDDKITGTAIYDLELPEDSQDFCWYIKDEDVPSKEVFQIIKIINENNWCDVDKIIVSEEELFKKTNWTDRDLFDKHYNDIFEVEIRMVDEGEENDSFFVHT